MSIESRWDRLRRVLAKSWHPIPARAEAWVGKALLSWIGGTTFALFLAEEAFWRSSPGGLVWAGAVYGAIGWIIYSGTAKYRMRHGLTWAQASLRVLVIGIALALLGFAINNRAMVAALLPVIGLFIIYLIIGLVVLYLVVPVVRAAWRHGDPR